MRKEISPKRLNRLYIQGFDGVPEEQLNEAGPWLRMAFALCALFAAIGTALASPAFLSVLAVIAASGAIFPVHPFDLLYNYSIRYLTGTRPLPKRGMPTRFACGIGSIWLLLTIWTFHAEYILAGYILGGSLVLLATLVSVTDICVPSMIYRAIWGYNNNSKLSTDTVSQN